MKVNMRSSDKLVSDELMKGDVKEDKKVDDGLKERFERLLEDVGEDTGDAREKFPDIAGAILQRMSAKSNATLKEPEAMEVKPAKELVDVANEIAESLMVSEGKVGDSKEIRIHFKEHILPETEVVIRKEQGTLKVEFHTKDLHVQRLLSQNLSDLREHLQAKVDMRIQVEVNIDNETDGRSRGRYLYDEETF